MSLRAKYFLLAVIVVGTVGIWLPLGIEKIVDKTVTFHNIPQNMTTYFVAILFAGCIDYFLSKLNDAKSGIKSAFFNVIGLLLLMIGLTIGAILTYIYKEDGVSVLISLIGILIAWRLWWIANENNPNFIDATDSMGGNPANPLNK